MFHSGLAPCPLEDGNDLTANPVTLDIRFQPVTLLEIEHAGQNQNTMSRDKKLIGPHRADPELCGRRD
jgi:hypothetical protein